MNASEQLDKSEILSRLKKIAGQVKGIQRMIEEEKCCSDVMVQISAIRSAINKVGGLIMDKYIKECIKSSVLENKINEIDEVIDTIVKYVK